MRKEVAMTIEQLKEASELRWAIDDLERKSAMLEKATVCVDNTKMDYGFSEEAIELLPEEQETIESIRQAYLTILRTANNRKLAELTTKFEEL